MRPSDPYRKKSSNFLLHRYGDLAPVTVGGRIIACFCALSGTGTIAMLTSVIVDRYQRIYNRRMYIKPKAIRSEDIFNNEQNDLESKPPK